jgi:ABC-type dipeptide/oligopeptide/nickel transport system ATPase component
MNTNMIDITVAPGVKQRTVTLVCQDGSTFSFPKSDCALLPIVHTTTEEIAVYLWGRILEHVNGEYLVSHRVHTMQVNLIESFGQQTTYRSAIPNKQSQSSSESFHVVNCIREHEEHHLPEPFVLRQVTPKGSPEVSVVSDGSTSTRELAEV